MRTTALLHKPLLSYSLLRSALFSAEGLFIPAIDALVNLRRPRLLTDDMTLFKNAQLELFKLLKEDVENIVTGYYPLQVLQPENPWRHTLRIPKLFVQGIKAAQRKARQEAHVFDSEAAELMADLPSYYQRNFHFQESGYLSDESAELYEHQVDVLFAGGADAMRRLILPPLKDFSKTSSGQGLHLLEVAAGTGRASQFTRMALPKARLTLSDLSEPYLKKARQNFTNDLKTDFIQADASQLPFQDQTFNGTYSVFLFHELPQAERSKVIKEALRVTKPGGFIGMVDSLQKGDHPEFDEALADFPKEFHEPFYKNYSLHPLEDLLESFDVEDVQSKTGFFSKVVWGKKPDL
jgi:ubiquinone/menaquinone biosynthesis C-methylase UbiE